MKFKDIRKFSDLLSAHVVYSTYYPINAFYAFCQAEFATENFEFLLLVRTFHPELGPAAYDFFPANIATPTDRARYIYLTHIKEDAPSAPKMINIDSKRADLRRAYERDEWQAESFDAAHEEIAGLLDFDTFSRFQNWAGNDAMPGINIQASRAARAARAIHYNLPAHLAPAAVPVIAAPHVPAPPPQIQMAAQPAQGFHRPMLAASQLPLTAGQIVPAVPAPPPLPAVVVAAPPAVVDRAREIERDLPKQILRKANGPPLVIKRVKPAPPPLPPLPASVLAKKKPVPPVPVFPNKPAPAPPTAPSAFTRQPIQPPVPVFPNKK